jgi:hypothetical protein
MRKVIFVLSLLSSFGCGSQKQDARIQSLEADVKQLKTEMSELRGKPKTPEHHYELRVQGLRTWRFDPATGETCIQLTTSEDWKRKETRNQSCDCSDSMQHWMEMPQETEQQQKWAEGYYRHVQSACGE